MRYLVISLSLWLLLVNPVLAEEIGKVIAARGDTYAVNPEGTQRELKRRSVVFTGDTLFTGSAARLQIRFADGTLLALRPESEYRIDNYQFNEAEDDENFSTLLKGGFRTITGVISKKNPEAYQVETPVATIGVRGTNYETALTPKGLDVAAWQGGIKIRTDVGELEIGVGRDYNFATVGAPNTKPQGLLKPPPSMSGPLVDSGTPEAPSAATEAEPESGSTTETDAEQPVSEQADTSDEVASTTSEGPAVTDAGGTEQETTDTGLDGTLSGGKTGTKRGDDGLMADIGFNGNAAGDIASDDPTLTTIEPPEGIDDFIDTIAENDRRMDPTEWEKLYTDGYGGFMVFGGQNSNHIIGGRALAPAGTKPPVLTETHLEPFDPAFKTAGVDFVYRKGMAPPGLSGTVSVGTENVYWGIWNAGTTPADKLIDPLDANQVEPINDVVYWAVARPVDPTRNDVAVFNFVDTFHGGGSLGTLSPGDVTQLSMTIDFFTGAVTNGVFDLNKSPDNWNVLFDGAINGSFLQLNIKPGSQINALYPIVGDIGGFMAGKGGKAVVGGFDLEEDGNPSNHIEGIFILRE